MKSELKFCVQRNKFFLYIETLSTPIEVFVQKKAALMIILSCNLKKQAQGMFFIYVPKEHDEKA